jgi:hypoxanthine-guanine phosphoribosyltransferase
MRMLKRELRLQAGIKVSTLGIRTRWTGERRVELVSAPRIPVGYDHIVCIDTMIGTGNTFKVIHEYLDSQRLPSPISLTLASLELVQRDYAVTFAGPYVKLNDNYWLFGFNADCLADGIERGRRIPFLGYLVPYGSGCRSALLDYMNGLMQLWPLEGERG